MLKGLSVRLLIIFTVMAPVFIPLGVAKAQFIEDGLMGAAELKNFILDKGFIRNLSRKTSPTVVNILTFKKTTSFYGDFHFGMPGTPSYPFIGDVQKMGSGSGFIINKEGFILTAAHVVKGADQLQVTLHNGEMVRGKVVGLDSPTDIALIKIDPPFDLSVLPLGDSEVLEPGDWVMAIGSPLDLNFSVTLGIVSGKRRFLGHSPYDEYIQIDAAINPGNSGGPLVNLNGEAVGINAAVIIQSQGLGFSVPINLAKRFIPQLKERGRVVRSWLGLVIEDITLDIKELLDIKIKNGALVKFVIPGSPAEKAGIQSKDVIVGFNGLPIVDSHEFPRRIARTLSGKKVTIKLIRNLQVRSIDVVLEEVPESGFR